MSRSRRARHTESQSKPVRFRPAVHPPQTQTVSSLRQLHLLGSGLIVIAIAAVYSPAIHGGYFWDDQGYVVDNPTLRSLGGLWQIWFNPKATPQYYPLTFSTFWLEYQLWGLSTLGYHLTNIALHAINSLLVCLLLLRLGAAGAVLAAAVFALHPVHVESVAWIAERKDVLSAAFALCGTLLWVEYLDTGRRRSEIVALLLFACAMFSKTIVSTLPATLLLLAWWREPSRWRRHIPHLLPFVLVSVSLALMTTWREHLGPKGDIITQPLAAVDRGLVASRALWFYAGELLWPVNLMRTYPRWELHAPEQYLFPLATVACGFGLWVYRQRIGRGVLVAVLFFVLTLSPILGLVYFDFMRFSFVADRNQYLASIGLIALVVATATGVMQHRNAAQRRLTQGAAVLILALLAAASWQQARLYKDAETLWRDTLARNPNAFTAHYDLGTTLAAQGKLDEAIEHFREAVRIKPDFTMAYNNWGTALDRQGRSDEALQRFNAVLRINPADSVANYNVGSILGKQGHFDDAIRSLRAALQTNPAYTDAHYNLGVLLEHQGDLRAAIDHFQEAVRLQPDFPKAHQHLQQALARQAATP